MESKSGFMKDTQILSAFHELAPVASPSPGDPATLDAALVFDACQTGVVLRAVLFVEVCASVGVVFASRDLIDWVVMVALVTGGVLPGTLVWLLLACMTKRVVARLAPWAQYTVAMAMGAVAGLYGCAMLAIAGLLQTPPWVASACSGVLLSSVLVAALVMRSKGRLPAHTSARLAELQSRIRPHFLFNTLNSAIALVRAEPAKAESLLEDLSDLFRHALVEQGEAVTLAEELVLAQRYLGIEQVRFGERLQVQWQIDPRAGSALLPPLLLQPLVENAVKHGVEPSSWGGRLRVCTELRGSRVVVRITNTLPADSARTGASAPGHGIALANVRARLALLHDVQAEFSAGVRGSLYEVRLTLPPTRASSPVEAGRRSPTTRKP